MLSSAKSKDEKTSKVNTKSADIVKPQEVLTMLNENYDKLTDKITKAQSQYFRSVLDLQKESFNQMWTNSMRLAEFVQSQFPAENVTKSSVIIDQYTCSLAKLSNELTNNMLVRVELCQKFAEIRLWLARELLKTYQSMFDSCIEFNGKFAQNLPVVQQQSTRQ